MLNITNSYKFYCLFTHLFLLFIKCCFQLTLIVIWTSNFSSYNSHWVWFDSHTFKSASSFSLCFSLEFSNLLVSKCECSVVCSSGDWIEFQILLKGSSLSWSVHESLFFLMNGEEVESWNHQDWNSEWESSHINLRSVPSAEEWKT